MAFAIVTFPRVRRVFMDGAPEGQTGETIIVQRGHHVFDLGDPQDYTPPSVPAVVTGTEDDPTIIAFAAASVPLAAEGVAAAPGPLEAAAPAKRARRGGAKKTASAPRRRKTAARLRGGGKSGAKKGAGTSRRQATAKRKKTR